MNETRSSAAAGIVSRAIGMLVRPNQTWRKIAGEEGGLREAFIPYAAVMGLIPMAFAILAGIAASMLVSKIRGGTGATPPGTTLGIIGVAFSGYIGCLLLTLLAGKIMEIVSPFFGAKKSWVLSCRVLIYAGTPLYVAGILGIIPILGALLGFLAIPWALFLLYQGLGIVLGAKGAKQLLFVPIIIILYLAPALVGLSLWGALHGHHAPVAAPGMAPLTPLSENASPAQRKAQIEALVDMQIKQAIESGALTPAQAKERREAVIQEMIASEIHNEEASTTQEVK